MRLKEGFQKHVNSLVDIVAPYVLSQVKFGISFCHSQDTFDMSDSNVETLEDVSFTSDVSVELSDFLFVNLVESWMNVLPSVDDILSQCFLV